MKNNYFNDIDEKYQDVSKRIKEDSEKINTDNLLEETVLEAINSNSKRENKKGIRIYSWVSALAACAILAVGVNTVINWNNRIDKPVVYNHKLENGGSLGSASGLTYAKIYEKLAEVDVIEDVVVKDTDSIQVADIAAPVYSYSESSKTSYSGTEEFYDTNEQTEDVHEGDVVKTDGKYIYTLTYDGKKESHKVIITKAEGENLENVSEIKFNKEKDESYYYNNIYVDDDRLIAIGTTRGYSDMLCTIYEYNGDGANTMILVYDISDRNNPVLMSKNNQEGSYVSSRLSDGVVYVITSCRLSEISEAKCVPTVNGELIPSANVYVRENIDNWNYTVVTTLDIYQPDSYKQTIAVAGGTDTLYASRDNLYLVANSEREENIIDSKDGERLLKSTNLKKYEGKEVKVKRKEKQYIKEIYKDLDVSGIKAYKETGVYLSTDTTEIFKFRYSKNGIEMVADTTVDGYVSDNLSFDEKDGYLRFVSTIQTTKRVEVRINYYDKEGKYLFNVVDDGRYISTSDELNNVYVLDENLVEKAHIEGLAEGEEIYSARYLGDYGYFVTYENTDPLFSVDFTDMENPKIIGELKITGFSEYLHFYTENKLFGLGRETNPKNGDWLGVKLEMYNITGKTAEVEDKLVLEDFDAPAMYDYKALMIDSKKSLIGFMVDDDNKYKTYYIVYTYEDNEFKELMRVTMNDDTRKNEIYGYNVRGFYIGDYLYIVDTEQGIKVVDLKDYDDNKVSGEIEF